MKIDMVVSCVVGWSLVRSSLVRWGTVWLRRTLYMVVI